jgi:hypothetical protein
VACSNGEKDGDAKFLERLRGRAGRCRQPTGTQIDGGKGIGSSRRTQVRIGTGELWPSRVLTERSGGCVLAIASDSRRIETSETVYNLRWFYPMPVADAGLTEARQVFTKHRGMLRTSDAIRLGIHPRTLYNLRDRGELEEVGRGIYRLATAPQLTSPDLVSVAIRIPRAVICLVSALAHHGLTTQVPHTVDVALPSHAQVPSRLSLALARGALRVADQSLFRFLSASVIVRQSITN